MKGFSSLVPALLICSVPILVVADDFADAMGRTGSLDGRWIGTTENVNNATGEVTQTEASFTRASDPSNEMGFSMWSPSFLMRTTYLGEGRYLRLTWNPAGRYVERTEYKSAFLEGPNELGDYTLVSTAWMTQPNGSSYERRDTTEYEDGVLTMTAEVRPPGGEGPFRRLSTTTYTRAADAPPPSGPLMTGRPITEQDYDNTNWQAIAMSTAADLLEENYIYEDKGTLLADYLRDNLDAFAKITDKTQFATALTDGLQSVVNDGHLRVTYVFGQPESTEARTDADRPFDCRVATIEHRWLDDHIGYIQIPHFSRNMESLLPRFETAMRELVDADALILDLRGNCGGSDEITLEMMSYFFAEPTLLGATEERGHHLSETWSLAEVPGPRFPNRPIYILVNRRTSSAGEFFAFALGQVTDRAVVVGSRTAGLGHFGGFYPLDSEFRMFIPRGRPFDPETGLGFEIDGVEPDVETSSDEALDVATTDYLARRSGSSAQQ